MVFAHAPAIIPAVLGVRLAYHPVLYAPLALLHASHVLRLAGGEVAGSLVAWRWGGLLNEVAIVLFVALAAARVAVARRPAAGGRCATRDARRPWAPAAAERGRPAGIVQATPEVRGARIEGAMTSKRSIVINGDLGSGKTTVSVRLAEALGLRRISIGDLYRRMAGERGMTALQLNLHAELDNEVDGYVDRLQREIAASGEQLVVDSRLAWAFFPDAFKVHLVTDPVVAAARVLARPASEVERYGSVAEAAARLRSRSDSERARFLSRYGVDKARLRNYDLVCDTSRAAPEEIVDLIVAAVAGRLHRNVLRDRPPLLLLDPRRLRPPLPRGPRDVAPIPAEAAGGQDGLPPLAVSRTGPVFSLVGGLLSAAARRLTLVPAVLVAEDGDAARAPAASSPAGAARDTTTPS